MGYHIIRGPFMLQETMGMLFQFVNGVAYRYTPGRKSYLSGTNVQEAEMLTRRCNRLQEITEEVCHDLDIHDPVVQRFFGRTTVDCESLCLAQHMVRSFCTLREPDFRKNAEEICRIWHQLQAQGAWMHPQGIGGLVFSDKPGSPGDLFDQVSGTVFPVEYQMKLYGALRNFDKAMQELVELTEPYAQRLKVILNQESWLYEEAENYWQETFREMTPEEFLLSAGGQSFVYGAGEETRISICMMSRNLLSYEMVHDSLLGLEYNTLILGSGMTRGAVVRSHGGGTTDVIGSILRALGEKKRLEILQHLSQNRSYCHELADLMDINPGNMSRHLAALYHYGFIRQDREPSRHYYETDREAIHNFFQLVESVIFGEQ